MLLLVPDLRWDWLEGSSTYLSFNFYNLQIHMLMWCWLFRQNRSKVGSMDQPTNNYKEKVDILHTCINVLGSAIVKYLIKTQQCAWSYSLGRFSVLSRANFDYHLKMLRSVHIKSYQPFLCKWKEWLVGLKINSL